MAELRQRLVGKPLFLRGGYLNDNLNFNALGELTGHSPQGSYTLNAIQINRVQLTKRRVELEGSRSGLHFLGQLAYEDTSSAYDQVRITPKKKIVKITIDRQEIVSPRKMKEKSSGKAKEKDKAKHGKHATAKAATAPAAQPVSSSAPVTPDTPAAPVAAAPSLPSAHAAHSAPAAPTKGKAPLTEGQANQILLNALDKIFAVGLDERMIAAMPEFWQLYYQAVAAKTDYRPSDPAIFRQNTVDQKARLLTAFEPASNEYAQANAVAGMALYHTVVGPDGKAQEIVIGRPIGFGLDENAVASIRKASFQPAVKDGKPVAVLLDLVIQFRIYSNRTAASTPPSSSASSVAPSPTSSTPNSTPNATPNATPTTTPAGTTTERALPGPYSVPMP